MKCKIYKNDETYFFTNKNPNVDGSVFYKDAEVDTSDEEMNTHVIPTVGDIVKDVHGVTLEIVTIY